MATMIMNLQVGNVLGQAPVFQPTPPPPGLLLVYNVYRLLEGTGAS